MHTDPGSLRHGRRRPWVTGRKRWARSGSNCSMSLRAFVLDPTVADTDNDLLTDGEELENRCHPLRGDSDGDGLADGTQIEAGLPCLGEVGDDPDRDGLSNQS